MSSSKVSPGELGNAIKGILEEYSEEILEAIPDIVKKSAQKGTKTLKSAAASAVGGTKYKSSFKNRKTASGPGGVEYTIYSTRYQVAHLLEHGHVIRNQHGVYGVTQARPHWATAEKTAIEYLEEEIQKKVEES